MVSATAKLAAAITITKARMIFLIVFLLSIRQRTSLTNQRICRVSRIPWEENKRGVFQTSAYTDGGCVASEGILTNLYWLCYSRFAYGVRYGPYFNSGPFRRATNLARRAVRTRAERKADRNNFANHGSEHESWLGLSADRLQYAYDDNEEEYSLDLIKDPNPD